MTLEKFANLVSEMRHLQREYFKRKNPGILEACKSLKRTVDAVIAEMKRGPTLFDQPEQTP